MKWPSLSWLGRKRPRRRLTLAARTMLMMGIEVVLNGLLWIIASIVFLRGPGDGHRILGLALVAWTTGLRHGLDADHISAIDNATRQIISVPQSINLDPNDPDNLGKPLTVYRMRKPVTVGLFFSLGHSTIVFATIVAIAISANVANHLDIFGDLGGIIGASISGSFLILIGCINSVILYKTWNRFQKSKKNHNHPQTEETKDQHHFNGFITRLVMPILRSVDRSWKMYPVGVLFGLGFDTASSIALLSVALIAQQQTQPSRNSSGDASVVLLALLFTAGMTLVDSCDSCLMIWAYAPDVREGGWRKRLTIWQDIEEDDRLEAVTQTLNFDTNTQFRNDDQRPTGEDEIYPNQNQTDRHNNTNFGSVIDRRSLDRSASKISLILTLLSILIAFTIGLIVLLGLIGDQCNQCSNAADRQEKSKNGGLSGRWWLTWRKANDNSSYIGIGIVGVFTICIITWFVAQSIRKKRCCDKTVKTEENR